jgi:lipid II:glycine glycyltransferase (peptidoglycan interpeptide bridge formation enzyme)
MKLIEITDKNKWNEFVGAQPRAEFLQSFEWGEFQKKVEGKIMRFGVEENGELVAAVTLVEKSLPLGMKYFYAPRGPITISDLRFPISDLYNFLFLEIKKIAKKEKFIFLRFEPKEQSQTLNLKFQISKSIDIQVGKTIILDLALSEEDLLKKMHQKTRYNIRLAEKKGVKIREAGIGEFEKFWSLMSDTVNRDGFRLHSKNYYEKMLSLGGNFSKLFFGFVPSSLGEGGGLNGEIICAGIFCFFGDTAVYLHGASSSKNREVMAPHLLQWELIKKAKALGCKYYDFSGIDEKKYPGVTRFKRGFSGVEVNYPGTFDVIFNKTKYKIYNFLRIIRRFVKI